MIFTPQEFAVIESGTKSIVINNQLVPTENGFITRALTVVDNDSNDRNLTNCQSCHRISYFFFSLYNISFFDEKTVLSDEKRATS